MRLKGLELCKRYYEEIGLPAFRLAFPELMERLAFGLVGEGSDCYGYDDEISRDHDWGPGFCLWLADGDIETYGGELAGLYSSLPKKFMGFERADTEQGSGRLGVHSISGFYSRYIGIGRAPENYSEWRYIPEKGFSVVTNGEVFADPLGVFSRIREQILDFYPEDIRVKKIITRCALLSQAGQYNYYRCVKRKDYVAAGQALNEFIYSAISAIYLLNKKYMPFYKWMHRGLRDLPILGRTAPDFEWLCKNDLMDGGNEKLIEGICCEILKELQKQGLTSGGGDFLLEHCEGMMCCIGDESIRNLHIMQD
jgi:hypothetical protein